MYILFSLDTLDLKRERVCVTELEHKKQKEKHFKANIHALLDLLSACDWSLHERAYFLSRKFCQEYLLFLTAPLTLHSPLSDSCEKTVVIVPRPLPYSCVIMCK